MFLVLGSVLCDGILDCESAVATALNAAVTEIVENPSLKFAGRF
ncbi:hypothetical protein KOR42_41290 [Thalassoglobus neptunius]|uniref:Uncharacterized protein n=1 Tax=Thalassoglobus neptunius TaxID=1938619 RepID=A0A5C5WAU5_9PLAN|nr:hypothetical protein [Thalassoglobus neptunius]TWT47131.1 hypothetical protein KOR42_41290 [Thalassoglobus neptunius]